MLRVLLMGVLLMLIARAFWRVVDGVIAGARGAPPGGRQPRAAAVKLVRDPVCGTFVAPNSSLSLTARGQTHYFCSDACRAKFNQ